MNQPKYFTLKEMINSDTAKSKGIDNTPTWSVVLNLLELIQNVLDPIREAYKKPITVNSGYRCIELNRAVGSKDNSQHILGLAADITVGSREANKQLFEFIQSNIKEWDQLINENNYQWIHISYNKNNNRKQVISL